MIDLVYLNVCVSECVCVCVCVCVCEAKTTHVIGIVLMSKIAACHSFRSSGYLSNATRAALGAVSNAGPLVTSPSYHTISILAAWVSASRSSLASRASFALVALHMVVSFAQRVASACFIEALELHQLFPAIDNRTD